MSAQHVRCCCPLASQVFLLVGMQRHLLHRTWHAVLSGRGVLALEGRDTHKLLQGLVTSDVTALEEGGQPQHTAFLAHNGRMLFDAFLIPGPADSVLIEAEAAAIPALAAHLRRYKLRSKVMTHHQTAEHRDLLYVHCAVHCTCTCTCTCTVHMHRAEEHRVCAGDIHRPHRGVRGGRHLWARRCRLGRSGDDT